MGTVRRTLERLHTRVVGAPIQDHDWQQRDPYPHCLQAPEHPELHCITARIPVADQTLCHFFNPQQC
jgi:hypothetical protein